MKDALTAALAYAAQGLPVFPCDPANKRPYTPNGFKAATLNTEKIEDWWSRYPNAMIGVPTGAASGFWVLDIDKKPQADGAAELAKLELANGSLPPTKVVSTPSGGTHYWFQHIEGVRNRGSFAPGIDVRGEGGYVIVPGSVRADGCHYNWQSNPPKVADAPAWLSELIKHPKQQDAPKGKTGKRNPTYSAAAINSELRKLVGTVQNRNNQLNDTAFAIGQFVGASEISRSEAEQRIYAAAFASGYVDKDGENATRATIKSGLDAGERQPRDIPEADFQGPNAANDNDSQDDTIDAETLLGMEFEELRYVVPGYVVEGLTILGGKPKLGKSWLAYDLGIAVATGGKAMGAVECEQGDVIYMALEDNRRRVKDRLSVLLPPFRKKLGIDLRRLSIRTVAPRIDNGLLAELDKWRHSCENPRLIIIDVYMKVRPPRGRGEDVYAADYAAVLPLQKYASEHRLAIVLVTHTRKMEAEDPLESISGTNGVTGAADAILVLTRGSSGTTIYGRGRDIEEIETAMKFDAGKWSVLGDADEVKKSAERRKIVAALKDAGEELTPTAIASLAGLKAANVRVLLRKMVADGDIDQPRKGYYSVRYAKAA